jgi:membrane associated rhomboid family serine protease
VTVETPTNPAPQPQRVRVPLSKPFWTYALIGLTGIVFLLQLALGDAFTVAYGLKINEDIRLGQYWRLVTPIFFHGGILHFLVNMYSLYIIGPEVERTFGGIRFLFLYIVTGILGFLASFQFSSYESLGASGAIFGLVGAFAVFLYRNQRILGRVGRNVLYNVVFIILLNIGISFSGGIDMWGHFGGLGSGLILGWLICPLWERKTDETGTSVAIRDSRPFQKVWPQLAAFLVVSVLLAAWLVSRPAGV